jgi:hypothetical protein
LTSLTKRSSETDSRASPGHTKARAQADAQKTHWKTFYAEQFGLDLIHDHWIFKAAAFDMRQSGLPPDPRLITLLDDILGAARRRAD